MISIVWLQFVALNQQKTNTKIIHFGCDGYSLLLDVSEKERTNSIRKICIALPESISSQIYFDIFK